MQIRPRLEAVIEDMLDGHILLDEALEELEKRFQSGERSELLRKLPQERDGI